MDERAVTRPRCRRRHPAEAATRSVDPDTAAAPAAAAGEPGRLRANPPPPARRRRRGTPTSCPAPVG